MKEGLSKIDIIWSFFAKLLPMATGLITLPVVLSQLGENEIAMNYILLSVTSFVILFDLGFSTQFSRNFVLVFSGGQDLKAEGFTDNVKETINYRLLYLLIKSAKSLYGLLSTILLVCLLSLGTWYMFNFTEGFTIIKGSLYIWILFVLTTVFDFYFKFYTPLLLGQGKVKETSKISVLGQLIIVISVISLIYLGFGLWSKIIGGTLVVVFSRLMSQHYFYTPEIRESLKGFSVSRSEIMNTCGKLWHLAKQQSIVRISTFAATQLGVFFTGAYLLKQDVAGYGLLLQLVGLISTLSNIIFYSYTPFFSRYHIKGEKDKLYSYLCLSLGSCYAFYFMGGIVLFGLIPPVLLLIGSHAELPVLSVTITYFICRLLQDQHCICSIFLSTKNKVYDLQSSSLIGFVTAIGLYLVFQFTDLKLLGVVLVQTFVALAYPNWKWPYEVCKEMQVKYPILVKDSSIRFIKMVFQNTSNIVTRKSQY